MQILLRFKFRTPKKNLKTGEYQLRVGPRSLYIRLTVNGIEARSDYASGLRVNPADWNQKKQRVMGRTDLAQADNERLEAIVAEHKAILNRQVSVGKIPTPETIKTEWLQGVNPPPSLLIAYQNYLDFLDSLSGTDQAKALRTIEKWYYAKTYLSEFIRHDRKTGDVDVAELTIGWGKRFHAWLMKHRNQVSDTAAKYVSFVRVALQHGVEQGQLPTNPLRDVAFKRSAPKAVYFLDDSHVVSLAALSLDGSAATCRDLALLVCYTGLDYPDLLALLALPDELLRPQLDQAKLHGHRLKTKLLFQIPLLGAARPLIARYAGQKNLPDPHTVNKSLHVFMPIIGWHGKPVTLKILRKTAGAFFLNEGYSIEVVARILGHSNIATTQRHYVRVTDKRLDNETRTLQRRLSKEMEDVA